MREAARGRAAAALTRVWVCEALLVATGAAQIARLLAKGDRLGRCRAHRVAHCRLLLELNRAWPQRHRQLVLLERAPPDERVVHLVVVDCDGVLAAVGERERRQVRI